MIHSAFFREIITKTLIAVLQAILFFVAFLLFEGAVRIIIIAVSIFLSASLIVLTSYLNRKWLIVPLREITDCAEKAAQGEHGIKIETASNDNDIKALAVSINAIVSQFENLEQMRKEFVSNASHELKSPLTSIQGFMQAILDGTVQPQDHNKYLEIALNEAKRLSTMIQSMLDLSRLESGKNPIAQSRFDINEIIKNISLKFEPNLYSKNILLDVDFFKPQLYVYADKIKIEQVLTNLIDNAIKYSPNNTKINLTTQVNQRKVYISVKDRGIGISKKDQLHIWDRFYMVDRSRTPAIGKGTGLGLSIVKKIIDDHREAIWIESNKDAGTTFSFTLPLFDPSRHAT